MGKKLPKKELARRLGVSRGMLYYRHKLPARDDELRQRVEDVMICHHAYGHRRVADELGINRKCALRIMRKYNLKPARRCKTPHKADDAGRAPSCYPDITSSLSPIAPDVLWVGDFTFISFHGEFVYLATILDRFTAEVLGFSIMTSHSAELVLDAIKSALRSGRHPEWFHSDQGSEYNSDAFISKLRASGIEISMAPKASPWRNGAQESFFGRFKVEFGDPNRFTSLPELIEEIYIRISYYNHQRIHTRHRMPPTVFRKKWEGQKRGYTELQNANKSNLNEASPKNGFHICPMSNDLDSGIHLELPP